MTGLMVNGNVSAAGVTIYTKNGKTIVRSARSKQPVRRTRAQFDVRMRVRHTIVLWREMKPAEPMFFGGKSTFGRFCSLANRLPVVYIPAKGDLDGASLLLPGMPLSDGTLEPLNEWLGEVNGTPALLTDLKKSSLTRDDELRLYTVHQAIENGKPMVRVTVEHLNRNAFTEVDGCLALVDARFADDMTGWAVVRTNSDRCSSQTAVTRCTYYEQFTTEAAMQAAADSYGGLVDGK